MKIKKLANIKILILSIIYFLINFSVNAQDDEFIKVKGVVIDMSLRSVSYVNIVSKKTGLAYISKEDGNFYIHVLKNDTLIFSAISFKKKYVSVNKMLKTTNYITLKLIIYNIASVNIIGLSSWTQFKEDFLKKRLKPEEQKILVIKGLPDPFMIPRPVSASIMSPLQLLYETFKKEAIRKRKLKRWKTIYEKTWIIKGEENN